MISEMQYTRAGHQIVCLVNDQDPSQNVYLVKHEGNDVGKYESLALAQRVAEVRGKLLDLPEEARQKVMAAAYLLVGSPEANEESAPAEEQIPEEDENR